MPLYFAYGANMDVAAMARRCPRSHALGVARLPRHRFAIMPNGWGNVTPDARHSVHGVLWDLALADVRALDAFEDVGRGLYRKIVLPVLKAHGGSVRALVYIGKGEGGLPRPEYIEAILNSALHWKLPASYIAEIAKLSARKPVDTPPRPAPSGAAGAGSFRHG